MKVISVVKLLGTTALLSAEKGLELLDNMMQALLNTNQLTIDFCGYECISSTFLNRSFGRLCVEMKWDLNEIKEKLELLNLNEDDREDLELAVLNAIERSELLKNGVDLNSHYSSIYTY